VKCFSFVSEKTGVKLYSILVATSVGEVLESVRSSPQQWYTPAPRVLSIPPLKIAKRSAILFPGQGCQKVGMAKGLPDAPYFDFVGTVMGCSHLQELCLKGPKSSLDVTNISQPAIFVSSAYAIDALRTTHPEALKNCVATAGLSLGEYIALYFAGALSFEDCLKLIISRSNAMYSATQVEQTGMVCLKGPRAKVLQLIERAKQLTSSELMISNYLSPTRVVVAGNKAGCEKLHALALEASLVAIPLSVSGAFHTQFMSAAQAQLDCALAEVTINTPNVPVISNVHSKAVTCKGEIRSCLSQQLCASVLWEQCIRRMIDEYKVDIFYVIGDNSLGSIMKEIHSGAEIVVVPFGAAEQA